MGIAYSDFMSAIRARESSGDYSLVNSYGYLGAYQFGEAALVDLGFVRNDGNLYDNNFSGGWTGKLGLDSVSEFLDSPDAQDAVADLWWPLLWEYLKVFGADSYLGDTIGGVHITASGLIGGAHLLGADAVVDWLKSDGTATLSDALGTPISEYIETFSGYVMPFETGEDDLIFLAGILEGYTQYEQARISKVFGKDGLLFLGDVALDDALKGTTNRDVIDGDGGADNLKGRAGGDALLGGDGGDKVKAGGGRDFVNGGADDDKLAGNSGRDWLVGGDGDDRLAGGKGNDKLAGGAGADIFQFRDDHGNDKVKDFSTAEGDQINLVHVSQINSWWDLKNNHMEQDGDNVLIHYAGNEIKLVDVNLADLSSDDFLF